ncbi:hypothetical protein T492DRAFT_938379 [Pavlovales sp. CCMP2436]|nr:hypothetical protein T492DRAFT_938379 [Pavlovales sp. CCMP2436]
MEARPLVQVKADGAGRTAYLLKVPEHVFRRCCEAEEGEHIGEVELGPAAAGAGESAAGAAPVRLHLGAIHTETEETPAATFEVRQQQPSQQASSYAFAESGSAIALTGKVVASGVVQMPLSRATTSLLKRKQDAEGPKRSLQTYDGPGGPVLEKAGGASKGRELRQKMGTEALKSKLLSLFTLERPLWSLKQLVAETNQPPDHVTEVLHQVCTYHNTGENRHMYELNSKYRG